jgi:hypothetical protein
MSIAPSRRHGWCQNCRKTKCETFNSSPPSTHLGEMHGYIMSMFVCFESHKQFISYLATVTIIGDRATNLDLCLALTAFSSERSFTCHTYCDMGPPFLRSYPKDPWFSLLNAVLLAKEQSLPILNSLTRPARAGLELMTSRMLSTRLRQTVIWSPLQKLKFIAPWSLRYETLR